MGKALALSKSRQRPCHRSKRSRTAGRNCSSSCPPALPGQAQPTRETGAAARDDLGTRPRFNLPVAWPEKLLLRRARKAETAAHMGQVAEIARAAPSQLIGKRLQEVRRQPFHFHEPRRSGPSGECQGWGRPFQPPATRPTVSQITATRLIVTN